MQCNDRLKNEESVNEEKLYEIKDQINWMIKVIGKTLGHFSMFGYKFIFGSGI